MGKVVKVTDEEVHIEKLDKSMFYTNKSNADWDIRVGEYVEIFTKENVVILKKCEGDINRISQIISYYFDKLKVSLFVIFFFILFTFIYYKYLDNDGLYSYKENVLGVNIEVNIALQGDEMSYNRIVSGVTKESLKTKYKITDEKLYGLNENTGKYVYIGDITTTKLIIYTNDNEKMELTCNDTVKNIKIIKIIFLTYSGIYLIGFLIYFKNIRNKKEKEKILFASIKK